MEEIKKKSTDTTIKISRATKEKWDEIYNDSGFANQSMFMDELLERYYYPIKENKDLAEKINDLKDKDQQIRELTQKYHQLQQELEEAKNNSESQAQEIDRLKDVNVQQAKMIDELNNNVALMKDNIKKTEGHILVPVTKLDMLCLEYLADRENKHYNRKDITPDIFFMYAVREMLIKGNKFAIDSVPDSVIEKFKKQIKDGE